VTRAPKLELLWWEGCPSSDRARDELRAVADELGMQDVDVRMVEIRTEAEAAAAGFVGSPTIHIDGRDPMPMAGEPTGLTCRVYRRRDGRISPTPDPDDLRAALRARLEVLS
jgi:hypothetical protein